MAQYCDLHTHSIYSDGSLTPQALLDGAVQAGLGAIALTDHNTVAGLPEFRKAAEGLPLQAVPGIEISSEFADKELHIVALFVQPVHYAPINALLHEALQRKEQSNRDLIRRLCDAGFSLDYDSIAAQTPNGQINRAHVGRAMTDAGYTISTADAFHRYLNPDKGFYVPPVRLQALDVIAFLRDLGLVSILAHPFLSLPEEKLRIFLPQARQAGLTGMETLYAKFTLEQTALATCLAREHDLLPSGGSDFHGQAKPDIAIGTGRGDLQVPMQFLLDLADTIH